MQSLILSSLISIASAEDVPVLSKCTNQTDYVVVRCQETTGTGLKKCYKAKAKGPTPVFDDAEGETFCEPANANDNAATIQTKIDADNCRQCFKKKLCGDDEEAESCPIAGTFAVNTWTADLKKCFATKLVRDDTLNSYVREIKVDTGAAANGVAGEKVVKYGLSAFKCGQFTTYTKLLVNDEIDLDQCSQCVPKASKGPVKNGDGLTCPAGETTETCKVVEGKDEDNKKCFKKGTKGVTNCKEADKEDCEKCAAAYVGLFLAFAALLL